LRLACGKIYSAFGQIQPDALLGIPDRRTRLVNLPTFRRSLPS